MNSFSTLILSPGSHFCSTQLIPRFLQLYFLRRKAYLLTSRALLNWIPDVASAQKPAGWPGWPHGKQFAFVLTHDVTSAKGYSCCHDIMRIEQLYGFRSAFYFVASAYQLSPTHRAMLEQNGFEIGQHGSFRNSHIRFSEKAFLKHCPNINKLLNEWGAAGFRSPSMRHKLDWMHELNIEYDSSTFDTNPFGPQTDGVHTIFPFWLSHRDKATGYVELPYTLPHDFTAFVILRETSIDLWKKKLAWIAEQGGMALLITNPEFMHCNSSHVKQAQYPVEYYEEFLKHVQNTYRGRYWHALPKDIAAFVRSHRHAYSPSENLNSPSRAIHVCMPTYSFYESDNRVSRYADSLVKSGHSVDVFSLRKRGQSAFEILNGVKVHRVQHRKINERNKWAYFFRIVLFLLRSAVYISKSHFRKPYDLVHVHNVPDFEVFSAIVPKITGSKIILDIHDIVPELFCSKFDKPQRSLWFSILCTLEKASTSFADHVIAANDIWRNRLIQRSVGRYKCSALINFPDLTVFNRSLSPHPTNREFILYPGTLNWHQGLDIALHAFARIKDQVPQIDFHIYGEGPALETLINLATLLGIQDRVTFKNPVPIRQIASIMATAKCGIVPKRANLFGNEAFSTKIMEFMALGVPVAVPTTDIDTYYFDSSLVQFFKPGDEQSMAESLLNLLTNEALRQMLIANSLKFVQEHNWANKKYLYLAIVDSLTAG